jgi:predicted nucleotidyltransferase/DNA-binding XRE family transcriptional regulator
LLKRARRQAGLSQAELAKRSGTAQSVISVYESGRRQPSLPTLSALVEAAGTTLDIRISGDTTQSPTLAARVHSHAGEIHAAAKRHGVRVLGVFGSVARGTDRAGSDVDLLLDVPEGVGLFGLGRLEGELRELIGAEIDLVPEAGLRPGVREDVMADLRPL